MKVIISMMFWMFYQELKNKRKFKNELKEKFKKNRGGF